MAPKNQKAAKPQPKASPDPPKEYPTIAAQLQDLYDLSRPYLHLAETRGLSSLSPSEKQSYALSRFLETGAYKTWPLTSQKEFWKAVEERKIPIPLPKPRDLGRDRKGREVGSYSPEEYRAYLRKEEEIEVLKGKSAAFRKKAKEGGISGEEFQGEREEERNRRILTGRLEGMKMGRYESDPEWDDVVPIPQSEGEGALAAIAYTDEYAEASSYLRAVISTSEYSPRVLELTSHIISLNPAHYTVWLYRAKTLFALSSPLSAELEWVNSVALDHQKNYQIWHHRQLLIDNLYPSLTTPSQIKELEDSERDFMTQMFDEDAKNYHVWSYRQYLVRKLNLFNEAELESVEELIKTDVRNNSAWSHRFFLVFSDPKYGTPGSPATARDEKIPSDIINREIAFAQAATYEAPQNQSPWNYLRGVLRKGGRKLSTVESFARDFVELGGASGEGEDVKSSHALDFLADVWAEEGKVGDADRALRLLGEKYDRVRKNYWEWRRGQLKADEVPGLAKGVEGLEVGA